MNLQPEVKREAKRVAFIIGVLWLLMLALCFLLRGLVPYDIWNCKTALSSFIGSAVSVLNFLILGFTVQKASGSYDEDNKDRSRQILQASYRRRMLIMFIWGVLTLALPCFNAAGLVPLLFPGIAVKLLAAEAVISQNKEKR